MHQMCDTEVYGISMEIRIIIPTFRWDTVQEIHQTNMPKSTLADIVSYMPSLSVSEGPETSPCLIFYASAENEWSSDWAYINHTQCWASIDQEMWQMDCYTTKYLVIH